MLCPGYMYKRLHVRKYNEEIERKNNKKDKNNTKNNRWLWKEGVAVDKYEGHFVCS